MKKRALSVLLFSLFLPLTLGAQSVDILWQGEAYVPPFYSGRSLWSHQSRITLVAIPHGLGNPANLNYKWTKNGTVLGNINGIGKNTLSFVSPAISRPQTIRVEIIGTDKEVLASASTEVSPVRPIILVYESNPLYGFLFNKEVGGNYKLMGSEVTFAAFPAFFSVADRADSRITYEWKSNAGTVDTRNSVTYRSPESASGSARITLKATSKENILQSASKSFLVEFDNNTNQEI